MQGGRRFRLGSCSAAPLLACLPTCLPAHLPGAPHAADSLHSLAWQADGTTTWVTVNARCKRKAGQLGSRKGELVILGCDVPLSGRYVGIQIE